MPNDSAGHPRIDFAWGNMPMQPNTERGVHPLDPVLDSHEIAYLGWNGYPAYVPNTSHTGGASGSGGSGSSFVTIPGLLQLESFISYRSRLQALGLTTSEHELNNFDSALVNETVVPISIYPQPMTSVPVGSTVRFDYYGTFPNTYTLPLYYPSNDWVIASNGQTIATSSLAYGALPSDLVSNPTNYKVVLSGFSDSVFSVINGAYNITAVSANGPSPLVTISGLTLPGSLLSLAHGDPGAVNGFLVIDHI